MGSNHTLQKAGAMVTALFPSSVLPADRPLFVVPSQPIFTMSLVQFGSPPFSPTLKGTRQGQGLTVKLGLCRKVTLPHGHITCS